MRLIAEVLRSGSPCHTFYIPVIFVRGPAVSSKYQARVQNMLNRTLFLRLRTSNRWLSARLQYTTAPNSKHTGQWFNINMLSYQYRKSHCGDKTILRPSYLHNGISYTGKMASLYWIRALGVSAPSHMQVSAPMPTDCFSEHNRFPNGQFLWDRKKIFLS